MMRYKLFFVISFYFFLMPNIVCGETTSVIKPLRVYIQSEDQVTLTLSSTDINRLFVSHEKITAINAPNGSLNAHNDKYGSIYTNIYSKKPFTAFLTTDTGRHFSILAIPKSEPGQTVAFIPEEKELSLSSVTKASSGLPYEETLAMLVQQAMQGIIPYGYEQISKNSFNQFPELMLVKQERAGLANKLAEEVSSLLIGTNFAVRVVLIKNVSSKNIVLSLKQFREPKIKALAIANDRLAPQESTHIIEVLSHA